MTPDEARVKLLDAFENARRNGYHIQESHLDPRLADTDSVAYEAAAAVIRMHMPETRWDFEEILKRHRFEDIIHRQTTRMR
jgi:hypothetical protein